MTSPAPSGSRPDLRPVPCPSNPVLLASQSQWLFTEEELTRTPSQLDGMSMEVEHVNRSKGVNFITQVGIMLKLPQLTLATAAVYLHRYFMRYSMVDLPQRPGMHPYPIAATSLFLATKVEENVRKMRELVVACCRVAQKQPNLVVDEQSKEFWKWRDTILHHEDLLLEALCFDLQLEQPYRMLYDFLCFFDANDNKPLRNAAWAFVNDSMFTVLCVQFTARTIAAAALYAAARHCDVSFEDDETGRPWWEQIDVDLVQVRRACMRMAYLYENNATQKHSQHYPTTPIPLVDNTERTRKPRGGSPASNRLDTPDVNGRKRSREPDDHARDRSGSPHLAMTGHAMTTMTTTTAALNGERSPKRQRTAEPDSGIPRHRTGPTSASSQEILPSRSDRPLSRERTPNGHLSHTYPPRSPRGQPHRPEHPYRTSRRSPPPRDPSQERKYTNSDSVDPSGEPRTDRKRESREGYQGPRSNDIRDDHIQSRVGSSVRHSHRDGRPPPSVERVESSGAEPGSREGGGGKEEEGGSEEGEV